MGREKESIPHLWVVWLRGEWHHQLESFVWKWGMKLRVKERERRKEAELKELPLESLNQWLFLSMLSDSEEWKSLWFFFFGFLFFFVFRSKILISRGEGMVLVSTLNLEWKIYLRVTKKFKRKNKHPLYFHRYQFRNSTKTYERKRWYCI